MKNSRKILDKYINKHPFLGEKNFLKRLEEVYSILDKCYKNGGKVIICGNGGSSADSDHIVGELMKGFTKMRPLGQEVKEKLENFGDFGRELAIKLQDSLPAISLSAHSSLITATLNDIGGEEIYAQQVLGYGNSGDVLIGISTSGNSINVIKAGIVAKVKGLTLISLTGRDGGEMKELFDVSLIMPSVVTSEIQDQHSIVYHLLCEMLEEDRWER